MVEAGRVAVVLALGVAARGLEQADAGIALVAQTEACPILSRALQCEAAMAEEKFIEGLRLRRIADREVEVVEEAGHCQAATTSISTLSCGDTSAFTITRVDAGRVSPSIALNLVR